MALRFQLHSTRHTNYGVSPLPLYFHFLGPKCFPQLSNTSMLFLHRATNHLTRPSNIIRFSSFLFKNVTKYTLLHVTQESDHTLCTAIPIIHHSLEFSAIWVSLINPLKPELNSICYLLALLGAHHFLHVSRIRVKLLTFR